MSEVDIKKVEDFWNAKPCGLPNIYYNTTDKKSAFEQIEKDRYSKQPRILSYIDFYPLKGKKVLEIGCGIGTDGIQFARRGAFYTGVDLTETAVKITKERFALFGETGEIIKLNGEELPFPDNYFDHVYSFGVIHHSPHPENIVSEIYRVLKPGGSITIMLYNRTSFYYLIEVSIIRKIFFKFCDKKNLCRNLFALFNKKLQNRFESFRVKLEKMKKFNRMPTADEWVSMNTDDVFCPIAHVYSYKEAKKLFSFFKEFKSEVWFIDKDNWFLWLTLGCFMHRKIINWLEFKFGWFRMIQAKK